MSPGKVVSFTVMLHCIVGNFVRVFQSEKEIYESQGKVFGCEPHCKDFLWFHYKVGEENFYTEYDVKVQAINKMGAGPNSTVEVVMSAEDSKFCTVRFSTK